MFLCVESMVMSSAYVMVLMLVLGGGVGRSAMYMLNSVGESTPLVVLPFLCCVVRTSCYCRACIVCVLLCSLLCILLLCWVCSCCVVCV